MGLPHPSHFSAQVRVRSLDANLGSDRPGVRMASSAQPALSATSALTRLGSISCILR